MFIFSLLILVGGLSVIFMLSRVLRSPVRLLIGGGLAVSGVLGMVLSNVTVIQTGTVGVVKLFGKVDSEVLREGLNLVNPLSSVSTVDIRRQMFEMASDNTQPNGDAVVALTANQTPLTIDVGFPIAVMPEYAARLIANYGDNYEARLVVPAARSAIRAAAALYNWEDAVIEKRDPFAITMGEQFSRLLAIDLQQNGFTAEESHKVFNVGVPQLRKALPPERILNAVSEQQASEVDLRRQATLTQIAAKEAERRAQEGAGVKMLFEQLPEGFTAGEIQAVLGAISDKVRADALMRAVEGGQVSVVVMNGGTQPALNLDASKERTIPTLAAKQP